MDSEILARSILKALDSPLNVQEKHGLDIYSDDDVDNVRMFILLTHIAEAAVPSKLALTQYLSHIRRTKHKKPIDIKKHGRIPIMDKIDRAKLRKIVNSSTFEKEFSSIEFPIRRDTSS